MLNLLFQAISLAKNHNSPQLRFYSPHNLAYQRFKVMDNDVAQKLTGWCLRRKVAREAIENYLDSTFPPSRCATRTLYRTDEQGYLKDVAYNGCVPEGWHTQADEDNDRQYHWVEPVSSKVVKEITQLPLMPSYNEVASLIEWPYFNATDQQEDASILYHSVNKSLCVSAMRHGVYLDIPFHDNFAAHPDIMERLGGWRVPRYLTPVITPARPRGFSVFGK